MSNRGTLFSSWEETFEELETVCVSNRGTLFSSWEETFEELETVCLTGAPCSHPERKYLRSWRQCV